MDYVQIIEGKVNIIEIADQATANALIAAGVVLVDVSALEVPPKTGDTYDPVEGTFTSPPEPEPVPVAPMTQITTSEFMDRFTEAEQDALVGSDIIAIKRMLFDFQIRPYIDLTHEKTITAVNALAAIDIIEAGRVSEILEVQ
ncbi:MAG: hypothetical protein DRJ03_07490 [Chloroflexi bacterium]|nr:MAG: hypothetical protein DRJ03_07490 [Chloroflexota bacterium]